MKKRAYFGRGLAAALILCVGLVPVKAGADAPAHTHVWREDWAIDDYHHWRGCADPACRTLVPSQAEGYDFHTYDDPRDPVCNVCGWVRAVDPGHIHTWGEGWSSDGVYHWRPCTDSACPGVVPDWAKDCGDHVYSGIDDPTCDICGRNRFLDPFHTHTWGEDWSSDGSHHWHQCTDPSCPGVVPVQAAGYGEHIYGGSEDIECAVCGRSRFVDPSHTHEWGSGWSGDDLAHWRPCAAAGCPGVVPAWAEDYGVHLYQSGRDTQCAVCGRDRFVDPFHTHTWGEDWNGDDTCHWRRCTGDGCPGVVPVQAPDYGGHSYSSDEDTRCNVCGLERTVLSSSSGHLYGPSELESDMIKVGRGRVMIRPDSPSEGDVVSVTLLPEHGYAAGSVSVIAGKEETALTGENGIFTFTHPKERVKLRVVFPPTYQVCARDGGCPAGVFGDLSPDQWYHDGIHYCLDWSLMNGYDSDRFVPDAPVSGGMMAQILYNLSRRPPVPQGGDYQPTGAWYDDAAAWATGAGVMDAGDGSRFDVERDVTREQIAVMLWRYAGKPAGPGRAPLFPDFSDVSSWAREAVAWAADRGILRGTDGGRLDPGGKTTRAEAASMLVRFLEEPGQ